MKDVEAFLTDGLLSSDARNLFGRSIEGRDIPIVVDSEYAISDRVEDDISDVVFGIY